MCWDMLSILSQVFEGSALVFTSCFHRTSRSARGESLEPFHILLEYKHGPLHAHSPKYENGFTDFPAYVFVFQNPSGHLIPHLFLLSFLIRLLFTPGSYKIKQLLIIDFNKSF